MRVLALLVAAALSGSSQAGPGGVTDLDGRRVAPLDATPGVGATALIFMRADCPLASQTAPEIERVRVAAAERGVRIWLVYVDPAETAITIRSHLTEYGVNAPVLRDPDHTLVARAGVHVTPEAALFVQEATGPRLVYRGRLDDRVVALGKTRPRATRFDLREAIDRAVAGRATDLVTTPAFGCEIADVPATPNFARDVAPIVYANCAPCHRDGGAGPFPLTSYDQVRRRARQIVKVTSQRIMPPWPPVADHGAFKDDRRLDAAQIATLGRWVEQRMPAGDSQDLPAAPVFAGGWQLGTPDLVLTPAEAWTLPAEGDDVFRNFVLPAPVSERRYVRAMEILPGNARIVHHANALPDRSGMGRERDTADPGAGFAGMDLEIASDRFEPDSHFLFWKPGTPAAATAGGIPWVLDPGTDLILNLHLRTSGKPESVRPSLGLYFTDRVPVLFPMLLQLEHDGALDIPAGETSFSVTDMLTLPVAVQVLAVYPHAHYVAREVQAIARRPDGSTEWLVHIADWNLDWQAVYELATPLSLPRGTVIEMRWTYDNSAANIRNPNTPPRRVVAGNRAADEMSHVWLQVLPDRSEDRDRLQEAVMRRRLDKYPGDFVANANLGALLQSEGQLEQALVHLRQAVDARPDHPGARNNLATALLAAGKTAEARKELATVVRQSPDYLQARYNFGSLLLASGEAQEAATHFAHVVSKSPTDAAALRGLGIALAMSGRFNEAAQALTRSLDIDANSAQAHYNLGLLSARAGRLGEAEAHFAKAQSLDPADADITRALAEVRALRN